MTIEQRISTYGYVGVIENRGYTASHQQGYKSTDYYMARITSLFMPYINPAVSEKEFSAIQEKVKHLLLEYKEEQ
ncbi:MAG: hypothetical protein SPK26_07810 [Treponema sp.]|uniref:hypothetical protein n=1 Tax=uncultured Treponema sp. TaxID=162155 RepID=UPI00259537B7|nr:hypothetical protein [uncultured Treponema sp.]MDY5817918.1 hypothetical protein [Treponema sp.]